MSVIIKCPFKIFNFVISALIKFNDFNVKSQFYQEHLHEPIIDFFSFFILFN